MRGEATRSLYEDPGAVSAIDATHGPPRRARPERITRAVATYLRPPSPRQRFTPAGGGGPGKATGD